MDARELKAERTADVTNADGMQVSSMLLVRKEKATGC
jgi:hypothetical protein